MDIIKIKENSLVHSYKGGLKTSFCYDLVAIECDKPFIRLIFKDEKVLVRVSLITIETQLQNCFIRISRRVIINMHHVIKFFFRNGSYWICIKQDSRFIEYKVSQRREKVVRSAYLLFAN
ncbi:MAG: LytTR family transcriptional regulator [Porphyromonadaceae bacterium]|jgi:DNA-binding LytR/AlgR family response regulator|nr:LytTR family transcriptional regulator [Porphyromonadaceae bacterium]